MRAGVVMIEHGAVALIERRHTRPGEQRLYYLFPGGSVEPGETLEQAAMREAQEELNLQVRLERVVAEVTYRGQTQVYFLARRLAGELHAGDGEEMAFSSDSPRGSYTPVWVALSELPGRPVFPRRLAERLANLEPDGWPAEPLTYEDTGS